MLRILPYMDDRGKLYILKTLHNLFQAPSQIDDAAFEQAVTIVATISETCTDVKSQQYSSATMHIMVREKLRGNVSSWKAVQKAVRVLFVVTNPLVEYFTRTITRYLLEQTRDIPLARELLYGLLEYGAQLKAPHAVNANCITLSVVMQKPHFDVFFDEMSSDKENSDTMLGQVLQFFLKSAESTQVR
jgi:hypothetical protein